MTNVARWPDALPELRSWYVCSLLDRERCERSRVAVRGVSSVRGRGADRRDRMLLVFLPVQAHY
jgi:hypothetical protein